MTTPFSVMTWNVENLFPVGYKLGPRTEITKPEFDAKLAYLQERILHIKPDVLALQEIGCRDKSDDESFNNLWEGLKEEYPYKRLSKFPDNRGGGAGIRVGIISRLPLSADEDIVDFPNNEFSSVPSWEGQNPVVRMGRGALKVEVEPDPGVRIAIITAHLKSKLITYPTDKNYPRYDPVDEGERTRGEGLALFRRTAEAVTLRTYLNTDIKANPGRHTIVLGDFNDEPDSASTLLLRGPEDLDVTRRDELDQIRLYNLVDTIPMGSHGHKLLSKDFLAAGTHFSRVYNNRQERIDHILVSRSMLGESQDIKFDVWKVKQVQIFVDSILGEQIDDNPVSRVDKSHPDHAPVYARFEL